MMMVMMMMMKVIDSNRPCEFKHFFYVLMVSASRT